MAPDSTLTSGLALSFPAMTMLLAPALAVLAVVGRADFRRLLERYLPD